MMKVAFATMALFGAASAQCPGGKTGYTDSTCAITQDSELDANMIAIVQAVSDFKAAIGSAGTADDLATTEDETVAASWDFAGAMGVPYTAALQVRSLP
jgi:hypothetical protein